MLKPANKYFDYLIIACVIVIAYWQVSLLQYTIKCDAALLSLPWKKFVSDSLRNGYFPIWNPYINMGWTQGMELSTWYYPSWIFALFGKFRLSFLQTEITLHLILGAIGMYKFLSLFQFKRWALIHGSCIYILSGFFVGNFQHLGWTYYACWLPLFLFYFIRLVKTPGIWTALKFGFSAAMLVLCSYIPFTVTTLIFVLLFLTGVYIQKIYTKKRGEILKLSVYLLLAVIILVVICAPAIYTLVINLDTMYRSGKYNDQTAAFGSLVPMSWINFIFPFGSIAKGNYWAGTDPSMNNIFIGWISFLFIGGAFLEKEKRKLFFIVASLGIFALLLSFGRYFPPTWFLFRHVPFYEKLRFAAQFRLYFIFAASIVVAIGTQYLLNNKSAKKMQWLLIVCGILFLAFGIFNNTSQFLKHFNAVVVQEKNNFSIWQTAKFQSLIWAVVCILLVGINYLSRKNPEKVLKQVIIGNILILLMAAQMNMFHTAVANVRVPQIDQQFLQLPEKFTSIPNRPFNEYGGPSVGLTWTNTGGLYHVPSINCYHPYDSKNFGEYMNHPNAKNIAINKIIYSTPSLSAYPPDSLYNDTATICSSITLNPYGIKFKVEHAAKNMIVQFNKTPFCIIYINGQGRRTYTSGIIRLKSVAINDTIYISFLPPFAIVFAFVGSIAFLLSILFICIYKTYRIFRTI